MTAWNSKLTELKKILVELYPDKEDGVVMVDMAGIPKGFVAFNNKSNINWHNILLEANKRDRVKNIVQIAADDFPEITELKSLFKEVEEKDSLSSIRNINIEEYVREEREEREEYVGSADAFAPPPRLPGSAPTSKKLHRTLARIEEASRKHDLLVPSKKGLEKIIGDDDFVDIASWLYNALNLSKSVCKVETEEGESGTGFLLKGGFVMTNSHVIASKEQANSTRIIFNYMVDKENNVMDHVIYPLDSSLFVSSPEDELDYAIVKVNDTSSVPLSEWGFVELETFFNPKIGQKVTIIQHPNGNYKKMALPDDVIGNWKNYLFYKTDTQEGSSGSPVFNKNWKVVALHHAGKNEHSENGGFQINEEGEIKPSNRGILIKKIVEDLKEKNFNHVL